MKHNIDVALMFFSPPLVNTQFDMFWMLKRSRQTLPVSCFQEECVGTQKEADEIHTAAEAK